ncbi:antitoxin Xre/MbcA/ParS toxin-binding domain-containing protein [Spartinivicinus poritis]|uniref:DUF2384 domain-containing protein n=1 Tax=Spartinivicinus poritis TaxID=2994640 RepID=A0ABT5UH52_9GAMM|nr:antitoxin Xre/MbcA/ParS toxin-binding domain-containing protein [Spartinivicinus sp. A2-2]MDE1465696.1 DUF2384 domain-containing protein [Spartinivicinus sp. A2-2]
MIELSKRLKILLSEYPGDIKWERYASNLPEIDTLRESKLKIDNDLFKAIYWSMGEDLERVTSWLEQGVPALDGNSPLEVMKLKEGQKIIRTIIMRIP